MEDDSNRSILEKLIQYTYNPSRAEHGEPRHGELRGRGGYGLVFEGMQQRGPHVMDTIDERMPPPVDGRCAIKVMYCGDDGATSVREDGRHELTMGIFLREALVRKRVSPHTCIMYDEFNTWYGADGRLCMALRMDWYPRRMTDWRPQTFDEVRSVLFQLVYHVGAAVAAVGLEHRDLRPCNIMFSRYAPGVQWVQYHTSGRSTFWLPTAVTRREYVVVIDFSVSRCVVDGQLVGRDAVFANASIGAAHDYHQVYREIAHGVVASREHCRVQQASDLHWIHYIVAIALGRNTDCPQLVLPPLRVEEREQLENLGSRALVLAGVMRAHPALPVNAPLSLLDLPLFAPFRAAPPAGTKCLEFAIEPSL